MASEKPNPRIGVAAIIYGPNGEFVAGKRKGSHGAGMSLFYLSQLHVYKIPTNQMLMDSCLEKELGNYPEDIWSMAKASLTAPSVRH